MCWSRLRVIPCLWLSLDRRENGPALYSLSYGRWRGDNLWAHSSCALGFFLIFFLCVCGVFKIGVCYGHGVPTTQHPPQSQQWVTWETRSPGHHSTSPTSALHPWQNQHESSHGGLVRSGAAICSPAFLAKPSCVFPTCTSAGCTLIFAFHIWFSLWLIIFAITLPGDQRMGYLCAPQKLYLT